MSSTDIGTFVNSNQLCPLSYTLLSGGNGVYVWTDLSSGYELRLNQNYFNTVATYPQFVIKATAEGGAFAAAAGWMRIGPAEFDC